MLSPQWFLEAPLRRASVGPLLSPLSSRIRPFLSSDEELLIGSYREELFLLEDKLCPDRLLL